MVEPLPPDRLYTRCDPAALAFAGSEELADLEGMLGNGDLLARRVADAEPARLIEAANALGAAALVLPAGYAGGAQAHLDTLRRDLLLLR